MLDIFTTVVPTRVGNSLCKVGCNCSTRGSRPPADILAAALTWLGRLHKKMVAVKH